MALSATFTANFASFYDAVDKADAKLKDFGSGADKVGGRLNTLANQFSGQKIVQEATIMAKAVEEIGGVSKLTEKELARLGATTNEAVAKMKLLGMDVPKNLQAIADQTKDANKATTDWMGTFAKMAAVVAATFSVGAIVNFVGRIFDAASAVKDLSDQWGVSTTAVQQWTGAAKASGVATETVGKSVQFLTEKLGEGSDAYKALLANVGLSYDKLRQMPLEDAYKEVVKAIGGIKDETLQLDVAQGLLGASSKKMVGAIRDGFLAAADAQKVMSEETIKRLEAAQGAWEQFKNKVVIYSGEMLASVMDVPKAMKTSWTNEFGLVGHFYKQEIGRFLGVREEVLQESDKAFKHYVETVKAAASASAAAWKPWLESLRTAELAEAWKPWLESLKATVPAVKTTSQVMEELRQKEEALKAAQAARAKAQEETKKKQDEYNKALANHQQGLVDLMNTFSGRDVIGKANQYIEALKISIPLEQMTATQQAAINKVMGDAIAVYNALGERAPQAMYDVWVWTRKAEEATETFKASMSDLWVGLLPPVPLDQVLGPLVDLKPPPPPKSIFEEWQGSINQLAAAFADLGAVTGGVFGEITAQIAITVEAMNAAHQSAGTFGTGLTQLGKGNTAGGLANMAAGAVGVATAFQSATKGTGVMSSALSGMAIGLSVGGPWGAAIGAAAGAIKGLFNRAKELKEVKNLRNDFIEAAGGLAALREQAEAAGVSLTALLNAKKMKDLEAALNSVTEAFQFQQEALNLVVETAEKYGFTLEELGPALARQELDKQAQQLYQDFQVLNSAGIESVAITERMAESVNAYVNQALAMGVEIPSAMRPMLESFAKAGTLVDANGEAISDLEAAGISFSLTMSDGFKALIGEVKTLTDVIARSLGVAIQNIPSPKVTGQVTWNVAPIPSQPSGGQPLESYQSGTGGFKNFGAGTPVMLHGWEAVVPREESGAFATVSGAGGGTAASALAPSIVINAQGAFFDTPGDLQRLADRVNDALTAKYGLRNAMRAG